MVYIYSCARMEFCPRRMGFKDMILIMVESALLYTVTVALCIITDLARTNVYYGITDIVSGRRQLYQRMVPEL